MERKVKKVYNILIFMPLDYMIYPSFTEYQFNTMVGVFCRQICYKGRIDSFKKEYSPKTKIDELDVDSLEYLDLVMEIENKFQMDIPDNDVESVQNLGDLISIIGKCLKARRKP